jgi:hypothetical protein
MRRQILFLLAITTMVTLILNPTTADGQHSFSVVGSDTTVEIAIQYTTVYPGLQTWMTAMMRNPDTGVSGFDLNLGIVDPDLARFCQNGTGVCLVNVGGTSASCECIDEGCQYIHTWWSGGDSIYFPPSSVFQTFFQICIAACCIPDSTTDRCTYIQLDGQIYDREGASVIFDYGQGESCTWWSVPGDANGDSLVNSADVLFLINYLYRFWGIEPCVCEAADCNNDCIVSTGDVVYLITYLFRSGPAPVPGCAHCPYEDCRF